MSRKLSESKYTELFAHYIIPLFNRFVKLFTEINVYLNFHFCSILKSEVSMFFADIHIHALAGVDDGPSDEEEMFAMIDKAYDQGVRAICFTPH